MDLDIKKLQMMGLASANPLVKKTFSIKYHPLKPKTAWADPEVPEREEQEATGEISVYLRKMTAADQIFVHSAISQGQDAIYAMLHRSVYKEDGSRVFETVEDAMTVDLAMFSPLATLVMQINGALQKKSQPRMSSSAKSRSPSADGQSQNGKKPSRRKNSKPGSTIGNVSAP